MADIGWRPPPPTHFHASGRRFTHNSSGQSKNPLTAITVSIDSDHGIYRDPANPSASYLIEFTWQLGLR